MRDGAASLLFHSQLLVRLVDITVCLVAFQFNHSQIVNFGLSS